MSLIMWIVFGLIVGVIANAIDPNRSSGGLLGAVVLGISGAMIGGFLATFMFGVGVTGFNISSFFVAVLGSLILLLLAKSLRGA